MDKFLKIAFAVILKIVLFPLRLCKIKKKCIIFIGLTGGNTYEYSCNLKYLSEYIQDKRPKEFEVYWIVNEPEKYKDIEKNQGLCFLKHYTLKSFYYLMTANVIVSSGAYIPWFSFRKNQYVINTWHGGGAYKRIENAKPDANWLTRKRAEISAKNIDLFLSSSKLTTKYLIREAFLYQGEVMEKGMPRNDCIVRGETQSASQRVRAYYGIDKDEKVILYAPTYRKPSQEIVLEGEKLLSFLSENGEKWRFLYRMHRYQTEDSYMRVTGEEILSANDFPDMQMLLCATDILITDYSSMIWDYSFLFRPCFLFVPDLTEYLKSTGFHIDIHEWPFPLARTQKELHRLIRQYDYEESRKAIEEHHLHLGNCETGQACEYTAKRIFDICKEK